MENTKPYVIPLSSNKPQILTLVPSDPSSRYKVRQLQVQVVGKSKMIKTVLVNILDVAKDMQVPPAYIGTFMGYEIGAQAKFDAKKPERQQAFLSGEHDPKDLSRILVQFISEVVLCPVCNLPEILIYLDNKQVMGNCRACGGQSALPISNEKFKRYIMNHAPSSKGAFGGNKDGTKKETVKRDKSKNRRGKDAEKEDGEEDGEEEEEEEEEEASKPKSKSKSKEKGDDGVVWYSDTSAEAARKRREEMLPESILANLSLKDSNGVASKSKMSSDEVKQVIKGASSPKDAADKLKQMQASSGLNDEEYIAVVFEALFTSTSDLIAESKSNKDLLAKILDNGASQKAFLQIIEQYCAKVNPAALSKVSFIIKDLYDNDLLEEDAILTWANTLATEAGVKEKIAPLIKWLQEAEEESDEDEDDDDEEGSD